MDGGDGCTTVWMYLMSVNCTLKMVKMVNFMLCVFYHNLKNNNKVMSMGLWLWACTSSCGEAIEAKEQGGD